MNAPARSQNILLGVIGAVVGGALGYFAFFWIVRQGFYALIVPAALLGLGAGLAARQRIVPLAIACGVAGLLLGIVTEWRFAPFKADGSFVFFITHLHDLKPLTLIMLALGAFFSYRLALGFNR
ncbi:MAG: hypothetical protein WEB58_03945 [Planctomycetaceae bacterium]